jgi:hypothetical protein
MPFQQTPGPPSRLGKRGSAEGQGEAGEGCKRQRT